MEIDMGRKEELKVGLEGLFANTEEIAGPSVAQPSTCDVARSESAPAETLPRMPTAAEKGRAEQWVVFALAGEQYGLSISVVDSIVRLQAITAVPGAPPFVEGVTNLRGTVLPVIDLHKRFDLPAQEATSEARIIVTEPNGDKVGMIVDAVLAVRPVPAETVEPPSPLVATVDSSFITGIAKVEDEQLVILLDIERVLAHG
jgi:purine-binding chemotaxis protein CheW